MPVRLRVWGEVVRHLTCALQAVQADGEARHRMLVAFLTWQQIPTQLRTSAHF